MEEETATKQSTKTWIKTLAGSMILLAVTFAILATFMADIRGNTRILLERANKLEQRIVVLDANVNNLQRQLAPPEAAAAQTNGAVTTGGAIPVTTPSISGAGGMPSIPGATTTSPAAVLGAVPQNTQMLAPAVKPLVGPQGGAGAVAPAATVPGVMPMQAPSAAPAAPGANIPAPMTGK